MKVISIKLNWWWFGVCSHALYTISGRKCCRYLDNFATSLGAVSSRCVKESWHWRVKRISDICHDVWSIYKIIHSLPWCHVVCKRHHVIALITHWQRNWSLLSWNMNSLNIFQILKPLIGSLWTNQCDFGHVKMACYERSGILCKTVLCSFIPSLPPSLPHSLFIFFSSVHILYRYCKCTSQFLSNCLR